MGDIIASRFLLFLSVGDTADGLYHDSIVCFKVDLEIWTGKKGKVRTLVGMGFIVLLHILVICWMGLFALAYSDPKEQIPTSIIIGFALIILAFVALYVLSIYLFKIIDKK